jgi:hypothetical protein
MFGEQHRRLHSWLSNFLKVPVTFITLSLFISLFLSLSLSLSLSVVQAFPSAPSSHTLSNLCFSIYVTKTKIPTHTKQQFRFCKFLGGRTWEKKSGAKTIQNKSTVSGSCWA